MKLERNLLKMDGTHIYNQINNWGQEISGVRVKLILTTSESHNGNNWGQSKFNFLANIISGLIAYT